MPEDKTKPIPEIIKKINEAQNILIALSDDPSVDELAAAIGLSLFLDKFGKHATAIYSGKTPNALEFLKPEETFESTVDALQDFVIALNKEKADHLRYKLDGDFVKIYITPYKTRISEEDLDFSYGDFNIDLVIALDVANGVDLDAALREHGRIMHDAVIVNITNANPGKLGEIEWSDRTASSVSEMVATLLYNIDGEVKIEKEEATAFLTGIVAATNRFSDANTTPETMQMASKLMASGANQQLVSRNIPMDIDNNIDMPKSVESAENEEKVEIIDQTKMDIEHDDNKPQETTEDEKSEKVTEIEKNIEPERTIESDKTIDSKESVETEKLEEVLEPDLLNDLKAAEVSLAQTGAEATPEVTPEPVKIEEPELAEDSTLSTLNNTLESNSTIINAPDNLSVNNSTIINNPDVPSPNNPAAASAPAVPINPEINGVPSINYMPLPGDQVLTPPPAPPIDMSSPLPESQPTPLNTMPTTIEPVMPAVSSTEPSVAPLGSQPIESGQIFSQPASDPSAFKIPGVNP